MDGQLTDSYVVSTKFQTDVTGHVRNVDRASRSMKGFSDESRRAETRTTGLGRTSGQAAAGVDKIDRAATKSARSIGRASDSAKKFGRSITVLATGIVGAGFGLAKLGGDYEREFSKITGLVGIAREEVELMQASTLALAGRTAQGPQNLARAMFTLQSAGLRGEAAMSALEQSAQLAAGGMGDVGTIAQATTSILDQYASKGVDAADAADFLASTARAGNFESSQLAGSLGKVLPVASQLGISLGDVGGAVALLTRGNGNASESITQVAAAMRVLMAPSQEAIDTLDDANLTMQDIKDTAAGPGGLVAALQQMYDATGRNDEQFARMLGSSEAVNAAFQILNASNEALDGTFGAVADRAGVAAEVFDAASETSSFKYEQAMTRIRVAATDVGGELAPIFAGIAEQTATSIGEAIEWWRQLPEPVQDAAKGIGAVVAVSGPAAIGIGKLGGAAKVAGPLLSRLSLGSTLKNVAVWGPVGLAAAGAIGLVGKAWFDAAKEKQAAAERAEILTDWLRQQGDAAVNSVDEFGALIEELRELRAVSGDLADGGDLTDFVGPEAIFSQFTKGAESARSALYDLGLNFDDVVSIVRGGTDAFHDFEFDAFGGLSKFQKKLDSAEPSVRAFGESLIEAHESGRLSRDAMELLVRALDETADGFDDSRRTIEAEAEAKIENAVLNGELSRSQADLALAIARRAGETEVYTAALKNLNPHIELAIQREEQRLALIETNTAAYSAADAALIGGITTLTGHGDAALYADGAYSDFGDAAEDLTEELTPVQEALSRVSDELRAQYDAAISAASAVDDLRQASSALHGPQQRLDSATRRTDKSLDQFKDAAADAKEALDEMNEAIDNHGKDSKAAEKATAKYEEALLEATIAGEEFGTSVHEQMLAMIETGATVEEVARFQEEYSEQLRVTGTEAGITSDRVAHLIANYLGLPKELITEFVAQVKAGSIAATAQEFTDLTTQGWIIGVQSSVHTPSKEAAKQELESTFTQRGWQASINVVLDQFAADQVERDLSYIARNRAAQISPTYGAADHGTVGGSAGGQTTNDPYGPNLPVYYHDGGVVGHYDNRSYRGGPLAYDEVPAVLQTGERVLSRADNAWFERAFFTHTSHNPSPSGPAVTVERGAISIDARGSTLTGADVQRIVDRGIDALSRDITDHLSTLQ
ncbi:MAG: phage tail tape measure protein [Actinomycetota bacterium]